MFLLVPLPTLASLGDIEAKLRADQEYMRNAAPYPRCDRRRPGLCPRRGDVPARSVSEVPEAGVTAATAGKGPRLFELRTYESPTAKAHLAKVRMFSEMGEIEIFKRVGLTPVFFSGRSWPTHAEPRANAGLRQHWPRVRRTGTPSATIRNGRSCSATPGFTDAEIVSNITSVYLRPAGVLTNLMRIRPILPRRVLSVHVAIGISAAMLAVPIILARQSPPSGRLVFIGTYTGGTTNSRGIYAFRFDDKTGALTPLGLKAETRNPSFLAASPNGRVLYAVNEVGDFNGAKAGSITSYTVDAKSGT